MSKKVKFSSKMDEDVLTDLRSYAKESQKNISVVFTEAVSQYLARIRVRPAFVDAAEDVMNQNEELLRNLAK